MTIIYNKLTGTILNVINTIVEYELCYIRFGEDFINELDSIYVDSVPNDVYNYYIRNNELVEYNDLEKSELYKYNKILSNEERLEVKLKMKLSPTKSEIDKAETIIDVLELMSEVLK